MLPILSPRSPETLAGIAVLAGLLWALARQWHDGVRARVLAACFPALRENAARHLLPLAEAALRAGRLLERGRDPLEPGTAAVEPGTAELLRLVRGMRGLTAAGGALWLSDARAEIAVMRLWAVLEDRLEERLGAEDLALAEVGDESGLERLRPRLRRWLRGDPGPSDELWLLEAFGQVLAAEIRRLDRLGHGRGGATRRELRTLRRRLGPIPPGLPDEKALAEALGEYLSPLPWSLPRAAGEGKHPEAPSADG